MPFFSKTLVKCQENFEKSQENFSKRRGRISQLNLLQPCSSSEIVLLVKIVLMLANNAQQQKCTFFSNYVVGNTNRSYKTNKKLKEWQNL